jgi:nucleotide-binding universal stress UspA family protein
MQHILVPTDFSGSSEAALKRALSLGKLANARITLLHVIYVEKLDEALLGLDAIENLSKALDLGSDPTRFIPGYDLANIRANAQKKLDEVVARQEAHNLTLTTAIQEGRPSTAIVDFANANDVDLIVMGTHGRGPVSRMFLGSVTENAIRSADCPVLVVRK